MIPLFVHNYINLYKKSKNMKKNQILILLSAAFITSQVSFDVEARNGTPRSIQDTECVNGKTKSGDRCRKNRKVNFSAYTALINAFYKKPCTRCPETPNDNTILGNDGS